MKTRVLVVDDSALMRGLLSQLIGMAPDMEVVGAAPDAQVAREMIKALNPDVMTLDVQMPKMGGLEFLERLMRLRPMPVVMVSSFTTSASDTTLKALELGAVDFIGKPRVDSGKSMEGYAEDLVEKIRAAKGARLRGALNLSPTSPSLPPSMPTRPGLAASGKIIFVGASTGGTEAIKEFLMGVPADCPPISICQNRSRPRSPGAWTPFALRVSLRRRAMKKLNRVRFILLRDILICSFDVEMQAF